MQRPWLLFQHCSNSKLKWLQPNLLPISSQKQPKPSALLYANAFILRVNFSPTALSVCQSRPSESVRFCARPCSLCVFRQVRKVVGTGSITAALAQGYSYPALAAR